MESIMFNLFNPHGFTYSIGRSLLALSLLLTLSFNSAQTLIGPDLQTLTFYNVNINLFYILIINDFNFGYFIAKLILSVVVLGYRPQKFGLLHYWVTLSFINACPIIDGGDQINSNLTLLLAILTTFDQRKWHWDSFKCLTNEWLKIFLFSVVIIIKIQVSMVYFQAATAKFSVEEWVNGTAVYYWSLHELHGMPLFMKEIIKPFLTSEYIVLILTWGTLLLELLLVIGPLLNKHCRISLFLIGISFHAGIVIIHGLPSFFITMFVALLFLLTSWEAKSPFLRPSMENKNEKMPVECIAC